MGFPEVPSHEDTNAQKCAEGSNFGQEGLAKRKTEARQKAQNTFLNALEESGGDVLEATKKLAEEFGAPEGSDLGEISKYIYSKSQNARVCLSLEIKINIQEEKNQTPGESNPDVIDDK